MTTVEATPIQVKINPLFCYGVKPNVFGGIHFTRENYLLYVNGCGISLYHHGEKKQELVPLADKGKHLTAIGKYLQGLRGLFNVVYDENHIHIIDDPTINYL